ncbi:MAG: S8 family serine peptidase, partial [Nanoarchaeota archaeon]
MKKVKDISVREKILSLNGKTKVETRDYIEVEIPADKIDELIESDSIEKIYLNNEYIILLDESVPAIKANKAWELGINGSGIKVAVLDTGIDYENSAFQNRVILSEVFTGEDHTIDRQGHGTHVAGIIAGNGLFKGVAPGALLMNAKVLSDSGVGSSANIIEGIEWAIANGADIISLSLGSSGSNQDTPVYEALQSAIDQGITVVVASGNCGPCGNCPGYTGVTSPGNYEPVITVGAVDKYNNYACFSSGQDFGTYIKPDIVAPGVDIMSYFIEGMYISMRGTSMAAPHISGVAALLLQKDSGLNHYEIKDLLEKTALDLGDIGKDIMYGSGIVDVANLLNITINIENQTNTTNPTTDINLTFNYSSLPEIKELSFNKSINLFEKLDFRLKTEKTSKAIIEITTPESEIITVKLTHNYYQGWTGTFYDTLDTGKYNINLILNNNKGESTLSESFDVTSGQNFTDLTINEDIDEFIYHDNNMINSTFSDSLNTSVALYNFSDNLSLAKITPFPSRRSLLYFLDSSYNPDFWNSTIPFRDTYIIANGNSIIWISDNKLIELISTDFPTKLIAAYLLEYSNDLSEGLFTENNYELYSIDVQEISDQSSMPGSFREVNKSKRNINSSEEERLNYAQNNPIDYFTASYQTQDTFCLSDAGCTDTYYCTWLGETLVYYDHCAWGLCMPEVSEDCNDYDGYYCKSTNELYYQDAYCSGSKGSADCWATQSLDENCNDNNGESDRTYYCKNSKDIWTKYWTNDYDCMEDDYYVWCGWDSGDSDYIDEYYSTCGSDKYCYNGACKDYDISSAYWSTSEAEEGDTATMYVYSNFNSDRYVYYNIYENDYWPDSPDYITSKTGITDSSGDNNKGWITTYQDDWMIPFNSYYFTAQIGSKTKTSGGLSVIECKDDDNDGYNKIGSCSGTDCNDGDNSIHPGAAETCNNKDDDCDGTIDEGACSCTDCGIGALNFCDPDECINLGDCYYKSFIGFTECYDAPSLGHDDYCLYKTQHKLKCENNQFNCENNNECYSQNCAGGIFLFNCFGLECGCCAAGELWDAANNLCYLPCSITSISWDETTARDEDDVGLTIEGNAGCNGLKVDFEVYEDDCFGLTGTNDTNYSTEGICEHPVTNQPKSAVFSNGIAISTWTAKYQPDIYQDPEFYFHANIAKVEHTSENSLTVSTCDIDKDGYRDIMCVNGYDCNDNDADINPGRSEICNQLDDDCDGFFDENFDLNSDPRHCGSCNNMCAYEEWCRDGECVPLTACDNDQCQSSYGDCYNPGQTCCYQDAEDEDPDTVPDQYICLDDGSWASCSPDWGHTSCEQSSDYYCTFEDSIWKWRGCSIGCEAGECISNSCYSDSDCAEGYYCDFDKSPYACKINEKENECSHLNRYSCIGQTINKCTDIDNDGYYDLMPIRTCRAPEACINGFSVCQQSNYLTELKIEDAQNGIIVNKQPGDILEIRLIHNKDENIFFEYDSAAFLLESGDCADNFLIRSDTTCRFLVDDEAEGRYTFSITGSDSEVVRIIKNPNTIYLTNKQKLLDRFNNDNDGVDSLLQETYDKAQKEVGIVYYLENYISEIHPFSSYSSYNPDPLSPSSNNHYSLSIASFIQKKCETCENIIILGDDYVVPFYRVDYADISFWNWFKTWFKNNTETEYIYSDQPYIKETKKNMGDLDTLFDPTEYEDIIIVKPRDTTPDLSTEINNLKTSIIDEFGYFPGRVIIKESEDLDCDSYDELKTGNLILIGSRETNNVLKCIPWFDIGKKEGDTFKAAIEIERNVWGPQKYSIVVSGDDLEAGLSNLRRIMEDKNILYGSPRDSSTIYIHDMSNPPEQIDILGEVGDHLTGFALGTCEVGNVAEQVSCMGTDMVASIVPPVDIITDARDVVLYCITGVINKVTGKNEYGYLDGAVCGGSLVGTGITVGKYVTAVTVVGAVAGTAADGGSTVMKRIFKTAKVVLKTEGVNFIQFFEKLKLRNFKKLGEFLKISSKEMLDIKSWSKKGAEFISKMSEFAKELKSIHKIFKPEVLAKVIKNSVDYEFVAKAVRVLSQEEGLDAVQALNRFERSVDDATRLRILKTGGKYLD